MKLLLQLLILLTALMSQAQVPTECLDSVKQYTVDENGVETLKKVTTYSYDEEYRDTLVSEFVNGRPFTRVRKQYERNNETEYHYYYNAQEQFTLGSLILKSFDDRGRLFDYAEYVSSGGNLYPSLAYILEYSGDLLMTESFYLNGAPFGQPQHTTLTPWSVTHMKYDSIGLLREKIYLNLVNPANDNSTYFNYDQNWNLILTYSTKENLDGSKVTTSAQKRNYLNNKLTSIRDITFDNANPIDTNIVGLDSFLHPNPYTKERISFKYSENLLIDAEKLTHIRDFDGATTSYMISDFDFMNEKSNNRYGQEILYDNEVFLEDIVAPYYDHHSDFYKKKVQEIYDFGRDSEDEDYRKLSVNRFIYKPVEDTSETCDITILDLYPNPATTTLNISDGFSNCTIQITDVIGRSYLYKELGSNLLDINFLLPGAYFMTIIKEEKAHTKKFIKIY